MPDITNIRFDQRRDSLRVRFLEGDRLVDSFDGQQGGGLPPKIGALRISAYGGAGGDAKAVIDQADGIGIAAKDDVNALKRKRMDSGESLRVRILENRTYNSALAATVQLDRFSAGAQIKVTGFYEDNVVGQQIFNTPGFTFAPGGVFDLLVIEAVGSSQVTLRSIDFSAVESTDLRYQRSDGLAFEAVQNGVVIGQTLGYQNGTAPSVGPFYVFAADSPDLAIRPDYDAVDRTFLDQGEGIGIVDGDDAAANSGLRKRIDGDEVLGVAITGYDAALAVFDVGNVQSVDGANIRLTAYSGSTLVKDEIFFLGSSPTASLSFTTGTGFDSIYLSPGDWDTTFTFLSADFGAFPK